MSTSTGVRILLVGEVYSPNLGDQLIREALTHVFAETLPGSTATAVDWQGRSATGGGKGGLTEWIKGALPSKFKHQLMAWLRRQGLVGPSVRDFAARMGAADIVVIGGGELILDHSGVFPERIATVARAARETATPFCFLACGAEPPCGTPHREDVGRALQDAALITVRDERARDNLRFWEPDLDLSAVRIAADPAIVADSVHDVLRQPDGPIGVNVIEPRLVKDELSASLDIAAWYRELLVALARRFDRGLLLLTNGNTADQRFARRVRNESTDLNVQVAPRPITTGQLMGLIGGLSALVAARLHSAVAATACGVPVLGLEWSPKVRGFFAAIGRPECVARIECGGGEAASQVLADAVLPLPSLSPEERGAIARAHGEALAAVMRR
jgi:polysaccharide pyruvyl transferase WcaK-like protein